MLKHKRKKSSKIKGKGCSKCARITSEKVKYAKRHGQKACSIYKKDKNNLWKIINNIEENPNNPKGFNVQIRDKIVKNQAPRGKQLHTQSNFQVCVWPSWKRKGFSPTKKKT